MSHQSLATEIAQVLGVPLPDVLAEHSPALDVDAAPLEFYLVGLIGGKDVGKTSLANAIVGETLSSPTNTGSGTSQAIAYVHARYARELAPLLREAGIEHYTQVTHENDAIASMVLLDLPDIDSIYTQHVEQTRRVLRRLLFPIFVQSVEKYADQRPRELLKQVAQGNDPANFLFCLTKADLLSSEGESAAKQLREDWQQRLAAALELAAPPAVFLVSNRADFDLPALKTTVLRRRSVIETGKSLELAQKRRETTLITWMKSQDLPAHAEQAQRLLDDAQTLVHDRLLEPLLTTAAPAVVDETSTRLAIVDAAAAMRLAAWPIVGMLDTLLRPLLSLIRKNLAPTGTLQNIDTALALDSRPLANRVQGVFAELHQRHVDFPMHYASQRLWDTQPASAAVERLRDSLTKTLARRQQTVLSRLKRSAFSASSLAPLRWLVTLGAIVWFPLIQPLLEILLKRNFDIPQLSFDVVLQVVQILGAAYLLRSVAFLFLYFIVLWSILRYSTHRRVERVLDAQHDDTADAAIPAQFVLWAQSLLSPLAQRQQIFASLARRVASASSA